MGSALLAGILAKSLYQENNIHIVEPNLKNRKNFKLSGVNLYSNISDVNINNTKFGVILLAVKPQVVKDVLKELNTILTPNVLLISVVAGKNIKFYKDITGLNNIVRAMPNTPASIGKGITALYAQPNLLKKNIVLSSKLFKAVGEFVWLNKENDMDIVTAISGSGPAYVFKFIEIMIKAANDEGLDLKTSEILVKNTLLGASILALDSNLNPKELRKNVTSPGGTTEAAIKELEKRDALSIIIKSAIKAAVKKSISLSK